MACVEQQHHLPQEVLEGQTPGHPPPPPKMTCVHRKPSKTMAPSYYQTGGPYRSFCTFITILLLLLGATALTLYLVYRPHKPQFKVAAAAIYSLNATSPPWQISTTMQFTIVTRNPNRRVSIHYDRLQAFVVYRDQVITQRVTLPPLAHRRHSSVAVSPILGGAAVPVSAESVSRLVMDEAYGVVGLRVVVAGRLRWKVHGLRIKTGHYGIYVKCDVLVGLKKGFVGQVPLLGSSACKVDI